MSFRRMERGGSATSTRTRATWSLFCSRVGFGSKAGVDSVACLAAARSSGGAESRFRVDVRRDDQARRVRPGARRF